MPRSRCAAGARGRTLWPAACAHRLSRCAQSTPPAHPRHPAKGLDCWLVYREWNNWGVTPCLYAPAPWSRFRQAWQLPYLRTRGVLLERVGTRLFMRMPCALKRLVESDPPQSPEVLLSLLRVRL